MESGSSLQHRNFMYNEFMCSLLSVNLTRLFNVEPPINKDGRLSRSPPTILRKHHANSMSKFAHPTACTLVAATLSPGHTTTPSRHFMRSFALPLSVDIGTLAHRHACKHAFDGVCLRRVFLGFFMRDAILFQGRLGHFHHTES